MDDLLKKAMEVAGEVGEVGKDILEGLAREGKEVVDKVKDLLDGDDKPAEAPAPEPAAGESKTEGN